MSIAIPSQVPLWRSQPPHLGPVGSWLAALIRASSELLDAYIIGGRAPAEELRHLPQQPIVVVCALSGRSQGELRCRFDPRLAIGVAEGMWGEPAASLTQEQVQDAARELCGHIVGYAAGEVATHFPGVMFEPPYIPERPSGLSAGDGVIPALWGGDQAVVPSRLGALRWEVSVMMAKPEGGRQPVPHPIAVRDRIRALRDTDLQILHAMRVLGVDDKAADAFEQLVRAVGSDPALTARVLRRVNSALQHPRGRSIFSLPQALLYLGTRAAKNIVVSALLSQPAGSPHPSRNAVVSHSIFVGLLCQKLGPACQVDPDECYLLGLLHDLGRLVLNRLYPEEFDGFSGSEEQLLAHELHKLGITHPEAGAIVATAWQFPDIVRLAMTAHHDAEVIHQLGLPQAQAFLVYLVSRVDRLVERLELDGQEAAEALCPEVDRTLNIPGGTTRECLLLAQEQFKEEQLADPI